MINVSFNKGIFPDFLKVANVIPTFKKGEKLDPNNYKFITLLSNISKLNEKSMHVWLTNSEKIKYCFPISLVFEIIIQLIMLL